MTGQSAEVDRAAQVEKEAADVDRLTTKILADVEAFTAASGKVAEDHQAKAFVDVFGFVGAEHVIARDLVGLEFEFVKRRVENAQRVYIGVRKTFDRSGEIVGMAAFVDERPFTSALTAGVDGFFGDGDVDLAKRFAKAYVLFFDPIIRPFGIDQAGYS